MRLKSPRSRPIIRPPKDRLPLTIRLDVAGLSHAGGRVLKKGFERMATSADKVPMLAEGHRKLTDDLKRLRSERPEIVEAPTPLEAAGLSG